MPLQSRLSHVILLYSPDFSILLEPLVGENETIDLLHAYVEGLIQFTLQSYSSSNRNCPLSTISVDLIGLLIVSIQAISRAHRINCMYLPISL